MPVSEMRSAHLVEATQDTHNTALDLLLLQAAGSRVHPYSGGSSDSWCLRSSSGHEKGGSGGNRARNARDRGGGSEDSCSEHFGGR